MSLTATPLTAAQALAPDSPAPLPASTVAAITSRWAAWQPFVRAWMQSRDDTRSSTYAALRDLHRQRILAALSLGLSLWVIERNQLDDPRLDSDQHRERIASATRRKRTYPRQRPRAERGQRQSQPQPQPHPPQRSERFKKGSR
jgi:hypothetical protein